MRGNVNLKISKGGRFGKLTRYFISAAFIATAGLLVFVASRMDRTTQAATGASSHALGQFLSGTLLGGNLNTVAGIEGASASYIDGVTPGVSSMIPSSLDITALNNLATIDIPAISLLPFNQLIQLGLANQFAESMSGGVSRAASGAVDNTGAIDTTAAQSFTSDATITLDTLLPHISGLNGVISNSDITLGAITGVAALDAAKSTALAASCTNNSDPNQCRGYNLASATVNLTSPLVGGLTTHIGEIVGTLNEDLNGLISVLTASITRVVDSHLVDNPILTVLGAVDLDPIVVQLHANLSDALAPILEQTISVNGVSISLSSGQVSVDLARLLDLNSLPPNSNLLTPAVLQAISTQIASLLDIVQSQINEVINATLSNVNVTISGGVSLAVPIVGTPLGSVGLSYDGSLQALLDGSSPISLSTNILGLDLSPITSPLLSELQSLLSTILSTAETAVSKAGTAIDSSVTYLTNALSPLFGIINQIVPITVNVQENNQDGDGTFTEVAIRIQLLPAGLPSINIGVAPWDEVNQGSTWSIPIRPLNTSAASVDLGKAVVGPNTTVVYNVTLAATDTIVDQTTTVSGGGWPANTDVTLQMQDSTGSNIGDPITVTTDASGNLPSNTTLLVPLGTPAGHLQVVGTTAGGETATAPFQAAIEGAPVITSPANNSVTNDTTPTFSGTGNPDETVTVTDNTGTTVCTSMVGPDATWSCTSTISFSEGQHSVTATQFDGANTSEPSNQVNFTVDITAPAAPVITAPSNGLTTTDRTPAITGTAEANSTVTITINGQIVGTTTADSSGNWTFTPSNPLPYGDNTVSATATNTAGNTSSPSAVINFTIVPVPPMISSPVSGTTVTTSTPDVTGTGEPGAEVIVTLQGSDVPLCHAIVQPDSTWACTVDLQNALADGTYTVTAEQIINSETSSPSTTATFTVDTATTVAITSPTQLKITGAAPTITGTAEPGATVTVTISNADGTDSVEICTVVATAGTWRCPVNNPLADGTYAVKATATDIFGNTATSDPVFFSVLPSPTITFPTDGSTLTNDQTPTITGTGDAGNTITVKDENGTVICTAIVGDDGTWSCVSSELEPGDHTISATQTDSLGNVSPASGDVNINIVLFREEIDPTYQDPSENLGTPNTGSWLSGSGFALPSIGGAGIAAATGIFIAAKRKLSRRSK